VATVLFDAVLFGTVLFGCPGGAPVSAGPGGILMAYEVSGRVVTDALGCATSVADASVALFSMDGTLLDETRSDAGGHFNVSVRNPDAAESMMHALDGDDPTVQVALEVQAQGAEQRILLRLPRPLHGKEYRVRFHPLPQCEEAS
jgi:hypothetical protein